MVPAGKRSLRHSCQDWHNDQHCHKSRRRPLKKMWPLRSASLLTQDGTVRIHKSHIVMAAAVITERHGFRALPGLGYTSRPNALFRAAQESEDGQRLSSDLAQIWRHKGKRPRFHIHRPVRQFHSCSPGLPATRRTFMGASQCSTLRTISSATITTACLENPTELVLVRASLAPSARTWTVRYAERSQAAIRSKFRRQHSVLSLTSHGSCRCK